MSSKKQTAPQSFSKHWSMKTDAPSHIIMALDRMHNGLFIYFQDGTRGFYSTAFLHSVLPLAAGIEDDKPEVIGGFTRQRARPELS